jgi:hypothetical protein
MQRSLDEAPIVFEQKLCFWTDGKGGHFVVPRGGFKHKLAWDNKDLWFSCEILPNIAEHVKKGVGVLGLVLASSPLSRLRLSPRSFYLKAYNSTAVHGCQYVDAPRAGAHKCWNNTSARQAIADEMLASISD